MALQKREQTFSKENQVKGSKRGKRKLGSRRFTGVILCCIFGYMIFSFSSTFYQASQLKAEMKTLEAQLYKVQVENQKLEEDLTYVQTPEAIEKLAREKLGLVKQGEVIIMRARELQP